MSNDYSLENGASGWKRLKFCDCIKQINTGLNPRKNFSLGEGKIKYITAKNLTKYGEIDFSTCNYVDENAKKIIHKRSDIQVGDILFSSRAPVGQCHLIKEKPDSFDIGESIFSIRVREDLLLPKYFCLYLTSDFFVNMAMKNVTGSIIQEIRIGDLMNTEVIVPPSEVQVQIANCIGDIDEKIKYNSSICSDLESMSKLLYDYWFVQFDFPDKNGRPYKSSGGEMVWNEELKREIPKGWSSGTMRDLIEIGNGKDHKTLSDGSIPVYGSGGIIRYVNEKLYSGESVLIPRKGTLNNIMYVCGDIWTVDTMYYTKLRRNSSAIYTYYATKMYDFERLNTGTGVPSMTAEIIYKLKTLLPPQTILEQFDNYVKKWFDASRTLADENKKLTSLRDFLLPMLMNGQVKAGKEGE